MTSPLSPSGYALYIYRPSQHTHMEGTHQPAFGFDERSVLAVHLMVEAAGVAQVVSSAVTSPQRCRRCPTVHTLAAFCRGKQKVFSYNSVKLLKSNRPFCKIYNNGKKDLDQRLYWKACMTLLERRKN